MSAINTSNLCSSCTGVHSVICSTDYKFDYNKMLLLRTTKFPVFSSTRRHWRLTSPTFLHFPDSWQIPDISRLYTQVVISIILFPQSNVYMNWTVYTKPAPVSDFLSLTLQQSWLVYTATVTKTKMKIREYWSTRLLKLKPIEKMVGTGFISRVPFTMEFFAQKLPRLNSFYYLQFHASQLYCPFRRYEFSSRSSLLWQGMISVSIPAGLRVSKQ